MQMLDFIFYDANAYVDESQTKSQMKMKRGGKFLGYDNCPYLIILDLNARITKMFQVFKVEED